MTSEVVGVCARLTHVEWHAACPSIEVAEQRFHSGTEPTG